MSTPPKSDPLAMILGSSEWLSRPGAGAKDGAVQVAAAAPELLAESLRGEALQPLPIGAVRHVDARLASWRMQVHFAFCSPRARPREP